MNKEQKTRQIEKVERPDLGIVIEYRRESNEAQKKREEAVTVYSYEREMERVRKRKNGGIGPWIVQFRSGC